MSSGTIDFQTVFTDVRTYTGSDTITMLNETVLLVNKDSGAATAVTLPASPSSGRTLFIKDGKGDAATNNITLTPASGNVDGSGTFVIDENYGSAILQYTGSEWSVLAETNPVSSTELGFLNGVTAGTGAASKAVVLDSSGDHFWPNGGGLVIGNSAQEVTSYDGATDVTPELQLLGTAADDASVLLACFSTTATIAACPIVHLVKGGNAAIGSHTIVTDNEILGGIQFHGDDGADLEAIAAQITCEVDGTPAAGDMPGALVFSVTASGAETATECVRINAAGDTLVADGRGVVIGHTGQETVSTGDGDTDLVPEFQILGTAQADSSMMLACFSTTATRAAAPTIALVKGGNAAIGSHTIVTDDEILGSIIAYGDDGVDLEAPAAAIEFAVDNTPGAGDMPGRIVFYTTADAAETLTEHWRITSVGELTSLAAAAANVTGTGAIIATAGIAFTDVANAWIDDATHGAGTTTLYIGNQTIDTTSDIRVKKNVVEWTGNAMQALQRAPRVVEFNYDLPGDTSAYGPGSRGKYLGFIAQETIDWAPWVVNAGNAGDCSLCKSGHTCSEHSDHFWHVEYQHLVPLMVKALQEADARIKKLENA